MAAGAATVHLQPDHRSGTTWAGFSFVVEDQDEAGGWAARDLTGYTAAAAQFRDEAGALVMDMTLGSGITIPTPTNGTVVVANPAGLAVLTAPVGRMSFDVKMTLPSGAKTVELDGYQIVVKGPTV
jgi:hypothetical protein